MSMPYTEIKCEGCDESWTTIMLWGIHSYELPNGKALNLERSIGWCNKCSSLTPVEEIQSLEDEMECLSSLRKDLSKERKLRFTAFKKKFFNNSVKSLKLNIAELEQRIEWRKSRQSPPRCLKCSSMDILRVVIPAYTKSTIPLSFKHPECGGKLYCNF